MQKRDTISDIATAGGLVNATAGGLVYSTFGFQYGPARVRRLGFGDSWATIEISAQNSPHRVTVKVTDDGDVLITNQR